MSESKKSFLGKAISRKVISWLLVFAMLFGLTPADFSVVSKAAGEMNITVHYQTEWTTPAVQAWDGAYTLTGSGEEQEVPGWNGAMATPMTAEEDGWYSINIKGSVGGFQILDLDEPNSNTKGSIYQSTMTDYSEDTAKDLYYINGVWYLDKEGTEEMPLPDPIKATIHFYNAKDYTTPVIHAWDNVTISGNDGVAAIEAWGGQEKEKLTAEENGWYTVTVECTGAIAGLMIVDAETGAEIKLSSEQLEIINACKDAKDGTNVYFDGNVLSLQESDIQVGEVTPSVPTTTPEVPEGMESPVINEDKTVTFNYFSATAKEVYLAGDMNGWAPKATAMTKDETTGIFTVTQTLTAGNHEYKFVVDGEWIADPMNSKVSAGGNSVVTVPASEEGVQSPIVDEENGTITFNFDPADYGLDDVECVNLMGTVPGTDWNNGLPMELTEEGYYTVTVKDILAGRYQYKFKTSGGSWVTDAKNAEQESGNSLVIMPGMIISGTNIAGAGEFQYTADGVADEGSVKFSLEKKKTGFSITEDGLLTVKSYAKTGYFKLRLDYAVNGEAKYSTAEFYYTQRAAIYEYTYREDSPYVGQSDMYTWNNAASVTDYEFVQKGDKYIAYINADEETTSFGYIVRLYGKWSGDDVSDREYTDRTLTLNEGERYTKVRGGEGIEVPYVCASGKSYYDNGIIFNYRDDDKFYHGTMDTIKEAKVVINDEEYDMTYNEKDELFTYAFQDIEDGDYEYYFIIDGEKVADQYNPSGKMHYEKPEISVSYSITPDKANYDQNPVVSLYVTDKNTGEEVKLSSIEADITSLAGKEMKAQFSTITNKGVLYIDRNVAAGAYTIPITVRDLYGNASAFSIQVEVTDKETTDASWDEARIYFIVTDRFNDGDASNNGMVGYDTTKAEAYRGGDLAGITEKLGYLQELGINTIWITPIVDNIDEVINAELTQTAYHGYWAKDFTKLDEHLGTTEDLDKLLDEAHKHGIKVMVDIVVNHAGYNTNDSETFADMLRKSDELGSDFITNELTGLPDFKTEVQDVRAKLVGWQTAWANHTTANGNRIDYFRVDTVKHVEHETWQQLKASLAEANPNFKMIGEFYGASYKNTGDYLGNGQMDSELDFEFKSVAAQFVNGNIDAAEANLEERNAALTNNITLGQFLSSHDEDGFLYTQNYDMAKGKLAASLQITAKGQPVIYYGEEIGLSGPNSFGTYDNNRYDMKFDNLTKDQEAMLTHYKKLLAAREMYSETFATGTRTKIAGGDEEGYLVFKRGTGENAVYVALNTTAEEKTVSINLNGTVTPDTPAETTTMTDIYSGKTVQVVNNVVEITIPANTDGGTVILAEGKQMTGIEVVEPAKVEYTVGEKIDLSNLTVTGVYGDAKIALSQDAYVVDSSAVDTTKAGTYEVKVTAGEYTASFTIVVKAEPTVTATATPTPTNKPTATATATPTPVATYTIKYVMNKGTNNTANPSSYSTKNVKLKNPTRKGYTFAGWYTDKNYKNKVTTIKASTKKAVTVYAKWTKVKVSKPTIKSVKNLSGKKMQVILKKKVSGAKGYEISYSYKDKKVKKSVTKVTSTKIKKTIKNLKKGKTYYVKVRAYKIDSTGEKVYSSYSSVKKVKVAK